MRLTARAAQFLVPVGIAAFATSALAGPGRASGPATTGSAGKAAEAGADPVQENPAERKAVRGAPLDEPDANESPELREVHRFEARTFPRLSGPELLDAQPDDAALPLPPGLTGRWGGTGDIPRQLRSPEVPARTDKAAASLRPAWAQALTLPELPVRWAPQVIRYLDFFKSDPKGHAIMSSWLRKMERFRPIFETVLARNELPKDLIYLAMIESGFEPGATSNKSAGGVWQFMPQVARAYGLEVSHWVDARRDPERAAESAARYLKDLYVRFGSWHLAFAAYNAGYGAILRSISRYNTNDYWELCRHESGLPWETTLYVPKILAAAIVGHNRAAFGFADVAPDAPWTYDTISVPPGTSLATLARAAGTSPEAIQAFNPELLRDRVPPDRGLCTVRIPSGSSGHYAQAVAQLRRSGERVETLVLRFGETLDSVAKARGVSLRELKRLNGVSDTADLRGGTTILVPARSGAPVPASNGNDESDDTILVAVPDRAVGCPDCERVFYRTREGDTLDEIADVFRVSVDNLVEWNNLDPDAKLQPKLIVQVFVRDGFDRANVALLDPNKVRVATLGSQEFLDLEAARRGKTRLQYTARASDTLAKIAKRYGLAPGDLARINRLSATSELGEGQRIVVYSPTSEMPREITAANSLAAKRPAPTSKTILVKNTSTHATPKGTVAHSPVKTAAATGSARPASPAPAAKSGAKSDAKPGTKPAAKPGKASRPASASSKPAATSR
ncbi:MAG TPA: LysM peptidoglycan-binding domain-containing protein [Polyangia bacterium]|nr:LysM peptidoglycan-binding domain-containing protein [Polyangia bacterium]